MAESDSLSIEKALVEELSLSARDLRSAIRLLDGGATIPFIARYRKEQTGGMNEVHLRMLSERLEHWRELERFRLSILHQIEDQNKLTPELKKAVQDAQNRTELEDLFLPFKPRPVDPAADAKSLGLEPLANLLLDPADTTDPDKAATGFIRPTPGIATADEVLHTVRALIWQKASENAALLKALRESLWTQGWLHARVAAGKEQVGDKFRDYFAYRETLRNIPSHRILAVLRGRKEGVLRAAIYVSAEEPAPQDQANTEVELWRLIAVSWSVQQPRSLKQIWLWNQARDLWRMKLRLRIELDLMLRLKERADQDAVKTFAENLRSRLMAGPAGPRTTLGVDPGFRSGVKTAVVGPGGKVLATATLYPQGRFDPRESTAETFKSLITHHQVEWIAIGDGTGSRETQLWINDAIRYFKINDAKPVIVSEAGASVYSASELAGKEFPDLDVTLRGAVSIARRLQDPLAELVKIDPKAIGVGQYQHDVDQRKLDRALDGVVEDCVNTVGVDLNTASAELLRRVAGIRPATAQAIITHRESIGLFGSRKELSESPFMTAQTFEQAAGFLRIRGGGNPLDASGIHPEAYPLVERMITATGETFESAMTGAWIRRIKPADFVDEKFGLSYITDVLTEIEKPGRDPRPTLEAPRFADHIRSIQDLKPGMILEGRVSNVADFGAFVDIGIHSNGLVHVSEIADTFVKDPRSILKPGQIVRVKVLEIDLTRDRIALSMRSKERAK